VVRIRRRRRDRQPKRVCDGHSLLPTEPDVESDIVHTEHLEVVTKCRADVFTRLVTVTSVVDTVLGVQPLAEDLEMFWDVRVEVFLPVHLLGHVEVVFVGLSTVPRSNRLIRVLEEAGVSPIHLQRRDEGNVQRPLDLCVGGVVGISPV